MISDVTARPVKSSKKVLIFGWSDTSTSKIDASLNACDIPKDKRKRSQEDDKGIGIAVVTEKQANCYKRYADSNKLIFANIHVASSGISSLSGLEVEYQTKGGENGAIKVGGSDCIYGGIVTDDPSSVVSGRAIGQSNSNDGMWSTEKGQSASVKMKDGGGRQYVRISVKKKK